MQVISHHDSFSQLEMIQELFDFNKSDLEKSWERLEFLFAKWSDHFTSYPLVLLSPARDFQAHVFILSMLEFNNDNNPHYWMPGTPLCILHTSLISSSYNSIVLSTPILHMRKLKLIHGHTVSK